MPADILGLGLTDLREPILWFLETSRHWGKEGIREWKERSILSQGPKIVVQNKTTNNFESYSLILTPVGIKGNGIICHRELATWRTW